MKFSLCIFLCELSEIVLQCRNDSNDVVARLLDGGMDMFQQLMGLYPFRLRDVAQLGSAPCLEDKVVGGSNPLIPTWADSAD